jgi:uncharacterized protein (DUF2249 family)
MIVENSDPTRDSDTPRPELPVTDTSHHACGCHEAEEVIPALDVRPIPHAIRHATVFGAWSAIPPQGSLDLVAPHDPKPLLAQLADRYGPVSVEYLDQEPGAWRLRLTRR